MASARLARVAGPAVAALGALLVLAAPAPADPAVTVRIAEEVVVEADELRIGDLGPVEGEATLAGRVREVRLGPAPPPGLSYRLDLQHVAVRLRQHRVDPAQVALTGADRTTVTRASQALPGEALIEAAARSGLERLETLAPDGGPYALVPVSRPADLRLPTGPLELAPSVHEPTPPYASLAVTVTVRVHGREHQTVVVAFRVARYRNVVVAAHGIEPRTVLSLGDFRLDLRPTTEVPPGALAAIADPQDLEVLRPIRAGEVITERMIRPRIVVRRGETITLVAEGQNLRVTTLGQAAEDARRGDLVRVVNPTSRREVVGRVEAPGLVRVTP